MNPKNPLHFSKSENKIQYEFGKIPGIEFPAIKVFKGDFKKIIFAVYFVYRNGKKIKRNVHILDAVMYPPTENPPTIPLQPNYIHEESKVGTDEEIVKVKVKCENIDDFDFHIRYVIR